MSRYPTRWLVASAVVALTLAGGLWWVDMRGHHPATRSGPQSEAWLVPESEVRSDERLDSGVPVARVDAPARSRPALEALHRWDRARSRAYASGNVAWLRSLYVAGSRAGTSDVRILRSYQQRGLHVEGMRMQILEVRVLGRGPGRWRLHVTDRLLGAVAVGHGVRWPLPRDEVSSHTVSLRRRHGSWRVASVSP